MQQFYKRPDKVGGGPLMIDLSIHLSVRLFARPSVYETATGLYLYGPLTDFHLNSYLLNSKVE